MYTQLQSNYKNKQYYSKIVHMYVRCAHDNMYINAMTAYITYTAGGNV